MKIKIDIEGHRKSDILDALRLLMVKLQEGHNSGGDVLPTRQYSFAAEGAPVEHYVLRDNPVMAPQEEDLHPNFHSAVAVCRPEQWVVGLDAGGLPLTLSSPHHENAPCS